MRIEILIFAITGLLIFNIYTEGKYVKTLFQYKKYYQMASIAAGGFLIYFLIKKNPLNLGAMLSTTNDYLKYMPIDKGTSRLISPILDFTSKQEFGQRLPVDHLTTQQQKIMTSGLGNGVTGGGSVQRIKRSVSETKKKFVAARQGWKCGDCQLQLNAWFEVYHKIRLEQGGINNIDNLVALCRECHGKKTTIENI